MKTTVCVITHAPLATAYAEVARHVLGFQPSNLLPMDINEDADKEEMVTSAITKIGAIMNSNGALVLTDTFGATPSNIARDIATAIPDCYLIAGINLPMLLRALNYATQTADELATTAIEGGRNGIITIQPE